MNLPHRSISKSSTLKRLVGVTDYKGSLVNGCAAVVRTLVKQTTLSDDDISARMLADESLQERASKYGVKLLELNVSTSNLTEPAQLAHAFKQEGIVLEGTPDAVLAAHCQPCISPGSTDCSRWRCSGCLSDYKHVSAWRADKPPDDVPPTTRRRPTTICAQPT